MLLGLFDRWKCEREYEDFADYAAKMKEVVGETFVKANKRPFGFVAQIPRFPFKVLVSVTSKSIGWKPI